MEYFDIAATYGETVIDMSTYTDNYVNLLAMDAWNLDQNDIKGWVREKGEFMLGLCEQDGRGYRSLGCTASLCNQ